MDHLEDGPFQYSESVDQIDQQAEARASEPIYDAENFDFDAFMNTPLAVLPRGSAEYDKNQYQRYSQANVSDLHNWEPQIYLAPAPMPAANIPQAQADEVPESTSMKANIGVSSQSIPPPLQQREPTPTPKTGRREGMLYLNLILNSFENPSTPLHVIDRSQYPFDKGLQEALEKELVLELERYFTHQGPQKAQAESRGPEVPLWGNALGQRPRPSAPRPVIPVHNQRYFVGDLSRAATSVHPLPLAAPRTFSPPLGPSEVDTATKKVGNSRSSNIKNFNPANFYQPLGYVPRSWLEGQYPGELVFQYNEHGELLPDATFTPQQIIDFISYHPLNTFDGKKSGLTLWIQVTPADSGKRYGHKNSEKCRFDCCPDPARTIRKGDFRIAFDEQYAKGTNTDPFHNAGYVHLYCMEKFIDFPSICQNYNVRPDVRKLREGKNKMALTRDHASMQDTALDFIRNAKPWSEFGATGLRPVDYYEHTLCYKLTIEHLVRQPKHLQKIREQRGGNSIDTHLNNLDKYLAGRKELDNQRKAGLRPVIGGMKGTKRKAEDDDLVAALEAEFEPDDMILERELDPAARGSTFMSRKKAKRDLDEPRSWPASNR